MALTKISTAMISQSAAAVDLNVDAGTFYVDTTNNRVGVGGKTDPDTPLHVVGTATATLFAGSGASLTSIPNSALVNSSITINSTAVSLGGSITLGTDDLSEGSSNLYYTDARVDARVSGGSLGNITTTGYIRGPATFTLDPAAHGDDTGTVVIAGNLQVDGTTTTINSTTLTVDDKNITLASGSANAAAADGAGFTVDIGTGTNPAITYDGTNDEWDFNKPLNVTGNIVVSGTVDGVDIAARDAVLTSTTTTAGAALPKAGGTMTGNLNLGDNIKAQFGADNDLQIYHDGSTSVIADTGTGFLALRGDGNVTLQNAAGTENKLVASSDGAVTLYHDNSPKLSTTSTGIDVTGTVTADGVQVGTTSDAYSAVFITSSTTGESELRMGDTDTDAGSIAYTNSDDTMTFRAAAANRMFLDSSGLDVTGDITLGDTNPTITFNDSSVTNLSHTILSASDNLRITADANGVDAGSRVEIFDGSTEVARFSAGAMLLTGTATMDGLTVDGNATISNATNPKLEIRDTTVPNTLLLQALNGDSIVGTSSNTSLILKTNNLFRISLSNGGDINFYEDTGTTPRMTWSSSTEDLSIVDGTAGGTFTDAEGVRGSTNGLNTQLQLYKAGGNDSGISLASGSSGSAAVGLYANKSGTSQADFFIRQDTGSGTSKETFRITDSGNVGIGTSSPRTKIDFGIPTLSSTLSNSLTAYQVMLEAPSGTNNYAHNIGWSESTGVAVTVAAINAVDEGSSGATGITFATGNNSSIAERMRIDSSGNVGIGDITPTAKLTVENNAHGDYLYIGGSTQQNRGLLFTSAVGSLGSEYLGAKHTITAQSGGGEITIKNDTYTWLDLAPNGRVAINHGLGSGAINSQFNVFADGEAIRLDGTAGTSRTLRFRNAATNGSGNAIITSDGILQIKTEDANAHIYMNSVRDIAMQTTSLNGTAGHFTFSSYNTEIMRIDGASNTVGIGTSSPLGILSVGDHTNTAGITSDVYISGDQVNADDYYARLFFRNSNQSGGSTSSIRGERLSNNYGTGLTFYTNGTVSAGDGTERMRIDSSGKVLVGTTSNNYNRGKFTVFGTPGNPATTGTNSDNVAIRVATTTGNSQSFDIGMYNSGDYGAWLQASNSGGLQSPSPIIFNPNGGNVGIGTNSPTANLEISAGAPTLILNANTQATNKKKVRLAVSQYTPGDFNIQQMDDAGTGILLNALQVNNGGQLIVAGPVSIKDNSLTIDSDYGHSSGRHQTLVCHNAITASNSQVWTDVAFVSYSPSLTIQGTAQRDNNGSYGMASYFGTIFGGYGNVNVVAERNTANPMNSGGFGQLEYRYNNGTAPSGNYRLQVRQQITSGTMYITTTLNGQAFSQITED